MSQNDMVCCLLQNVILEWLSGWQFSWSCSSSSRSWCCCGGPALCVNNGRATQTACARRWAAAAARGRADARAVARPINRLLQQPAAYSALPRPQQQLTETRRHQSRHLQVERSAGQKIKRVLASLLSRWKSLVSFSPRSRQVSSDTETTYL